MPVTQVISLLWLTAGALLLGTVTRVSIPPLMWLALTFLLHGSRSMPAWEGLPCLWMVLFAAVAFGNRDIIPASGSEYFAIVASITTTLVVPFALDRWMSSTLVFPMALVAVEFLRSRFAPGATWGSIAYSQYGYLQLMQLAALFGIFSITFLIAWFASTIDSAWSQGFHWNTPLQVCAASIVAVILGGSMRLAFAPTDRPSLRIAALNRPIDLFLPGEMSRISEGSATGEHVDEKLRRLQNWFLNSSRREASAGARLIIWPEQNLLVFKEDEPTFLKRAQSVASDEGVYLAMGIGTIRLGESFPFENKLVLIDPSGNIILSYRKNHAVEGWEAKIMKRGDGRLPVVSTPIGRIATAICYDADFPEFIRKASQGSAEVLMLPANDWQAIKSVHFQMAAFRAIENGLPLIRPAGSGISTAFDPWGRMLGMTDHFALGDPTLVVQVPVGGIRTPYARIGDLFAWLCVIGIVVAIVIAAMRS